jgi:hypothetical protein
MKTLIFFLMFSASASAFDLGSISREQALIEVCAESASLCLYVTSMNISDQGEGIRLPSGERVMPYRFSFAEERLVLEISRDGSGILNLDVHEK